MISLLAYIDPGTGSMMLQIIIGSALAGMMAITMFWRQLTAFAAGLFSKSGRKTADSSAGQDASEKERQE